MTTKSKGLRERLSDGEDLIVAEGYLFEFERRGYLQAGAFVPEVVIEHPELVRSISEEFVHAGSDVVLAFTYYGHREKMRTIGREDDLEKLNIGALKIAREVADRTGTLMAGNICNSAVYQKDNAGRIDETEAMFKEQIQWAEQNGADFVVGETFGELGEAMLALECIKKYGNGLPAVITCAPDGLDNKTKDGVPYSEVCRKLEDAGAAVVGLNCLRGPNTIVPLLKEIRHACKGPIAALPSPYKTSIEEPSFYHLKDKQTGGLAFPWNLPAYLCSRTDIHNFAKDAKDIGVQYVGLCCGNASHFLRVVAEVYGKTPPASRYSPNMKNHYIFGDEKKFNKYDRKLFFNSK